MPIDTRENLFFTAGNAEARDPFGVTPRHVQQFFFLGWTVR
jgi:hypothetical protein